MLYALTALALLSSSALAVPGPTTSEPTVAALGSCEITWTADTDTKAPWKTMNIELMTGANAQMTHMRTVATVDATATTSFTWVCPDVDLYAPVYFYQFSSPTDPDGLQWVTRFTITSTSGDSVAAPETDTSGVGWGVGHFVDTGLYNDMPAYLKGNGQLQGAPGNGTTTGGGNGTSTTSSPASSPTGSSTGTSTPTGTGTGTSSVATITKQSSSSSSVASSSTQTASTTSQSGAASILSSSSAVAFAGALFAGVAALF